MEINTIKKFYKILLLFCLLLALLALWAFWSGHAKLGDLRPEVRASIFFDIRLPRILSALFVGASLAVSGHVIQILLNNPLASSSTLGTASGAAFGATLAIYFTAILGIPLPKEVFAIGFSILTLVVVVKLSSKKGSYHTANVVLSGVIISTILSSAITFIKYLADEDVFIIVSFLMGFAFGKTLIGSIDLRLYNDVYHSRYLYVPNPSLI